MMEAEHAEDAQQGMDVQEDEETAASQCHGTIERLSCIQ